MQYQQQQARREQELERTPSERDRELQCVREEIRRQGRPAISSSSSIPRRAVPSNVDRAGLYYANAITVLQDARRGVVKEAGVGAICNENLVPGVPASSGRTIRASTPAVPAGKRLYGGLRRFVNATHGPPSAARNKATHWNVIENENEKYEEPMAKKRRNDEQLVAEARRVLERVDRVREDACQVENHWKRQ